MLFLNPLSLRKGLESSVQTFAMPEEDSPLLHSTTVQTKPIWNNVNFPWATATSIAIWFLAIHTPPFWKQRQIWPKDPLLGVHIVAASLLYATCIHNCLCTPSTAFLGVNTKRNHVWLGRLGLLSGVVSFSLGAVLAWGRLGQPGITMGFSLPITIGGCFQMRAEFAGYKAIQGFRDETDEAVKRKHLRVHIGNMITLFVMACCIPAVIRLAEVLFPGDNGWTLAAVISLCLSLHKITIIYTNQVQSPSLETQSTS